MRRNGKDWVMKALSLVKQMLYILTKMGRGDPVNRGNEQVTEGQRDCRTNDSYRQQNG